MRSSLRRRLQRAEQNMLETTASLSEIALRMWMNLKEADRLRARDGLSTCMAREFDENAFRV